MIPYFDYRPALLEIQDDVEQAIRRVLASGRLILGPEVRAFEEELAAYVGLPHAVGVNCTPRATTPGRFCSLNAAATRCLPL